MMRPDCSAPNDSILTRAEVAKWLNVNPREVKRLGVPELGFGRKTKRYLDRDVCTWVKSRRA